MDDVDAYVSWVGTGYLASTVMSNRTRLREILRNLSWIGVCFSAMIEFVFDYPVAGWIYVLIAVLQLPSWLFEKMEHRPFERLTEASIIFLIVGVLYFLPLSSRKPFIRDLRQVSMGMTEAEVRAVMSNYQLEWGAPGMRSSLVADQHQRFDEEGLILQESLIFRHSETARDNADLGIVTFAEGQVMEVRFSGD